MRFSQPNQRPTGWPHGWASGWESRFAAWAWIFAAWLAVSPAQAHLMAAQKGTLNLVGEAGFLVLSVPASALAGVDEDGDGALSKAEWQAQAAHIRQQVQAGVQLLSPAGVLPLQLLMVDRAPPDNAPEAPAQHVVVLGRFKLEAPSASEGSRYPALSLRFHLFGTQPSEQQQDITITRQQETQWLRFTPEQPTQVLLPAPAQVLAEYVRSGAVHVLSGADHVLFLLVVLAAGWGWRAVLGALTCFTAGHALTLAACVWVGWSVPERIVEPAIAATIVGMAAFDAWGRWRQRPARLGIRLMLVFACALIHGLGLAGALGAVTQWPLGSAPMLWALAGFNLGIEAAQVGVAVVAGLLAMGLNLCLGAPGRQRAAQFTSVAALAAGSFWFVERVLVLG